MIAAAGGSAVGAAVGVGRPGREHLLHDRPLLEQLPAEQGGPPPGFCLRAPAELARSRHASILGPGPGRPGCGRELSRMTGLRWAG
jgi:hypothetical protein